MYYVILVSYIKYFSRYILVKKGPSTRFKANRKKLAAALKKIDFYLLL